MSRSPSRGRFIAFGTLGAGLTILVLACLAMRQQIVREWYLWTVKNSTGTRQQAAEASLAELGPQVIPRLLAEIRIAWEKDPHGVIEYDPQGGITGTWAGATYLRVIHLLGRGALPEVIRGMERSEPFGAIMEIVFGFEDSALVLELHLEGGPRR